MRIQPWVKEKKKCRKRGKSLGLETIDMKRNVKRSPTGIFTTCYLPLFDKGVSFFLHLVQHTQDIVAKLSESKSHHLLHICLVLSPSPHEYEHIDSDKAGQQGHPDWVAGHSKEQLSHVFHIHRPGHDEEIAAKVGQVVTETLCPYQCALRPDLERQPRR